MTSSGSSHSLVTPIEPPVGPRHEALASTQHAFHATSMCRLEVAVASACGTQHEANEDAHTDLDGGGGLYIVADGVGGGAFAQFASSLLVRRLEASLQRQRVDADRVGAALLDADRAIARAIAAHTDRPGAATVVLAAPVDRMAFKWLIAWVGDCRAYRCASDGSEPWVALTRDDTFGHLGEPVPAGGSPDDPARMVGNGATDGPNIELHELAAGDTLVLCSDGVHKHLDADDWLGVLRRSLALPQQAAGLVALARAQGSLDDATVLLIRRVGLAVRRPGWLGGRAAETLNEESLP